MRCFNISDPLNYVDIRIAKSTSGEQRQAILKIAWLLNQIDNSVYQLTSDEWPCDSYIILYQDASGNLIDNNGEGNCTDRDEFGSKFKQWMFRGGCLDYKGIMYYTASYVNPGYRDSINVQMPDLIEYVDNLLTNF